MDSLADCAVCHNKEPAVRGMCRACYKVSWAKKERVRAYRNRYYATEKWRRRKKDGVLRKRYGLTLVEYEEILAKQDGKCPICASRLAECRPHVDHDHKTGKVRGILCAGCNVKLGVVESPLLPKLIQYLGAN